MFCRHSFSYGENALATSVLLVPRRLMLAVPFDRMLKRHQDWDWALRALNVAGTELCYIGEPLSIYSMMDGQGQMSGHNDWWYSLQWARDRKSLLTPKAFSFFIVTECMTRARAAGSRNERDRRPLEVLLAGRAANDAIRDDGDDVPSCVEACAPGLASIQAFMNGVLHRVSICTGSKKKPEDRKSDPGSSN